VKPTPLVVLPYCHANNVDGARLSLLQRYARGKLCISLVEQYEEDGIRMPDSCMVTSKVAVLCAVYCCGSGDEQSFSLNK